MKRLELLDYGRFFAAVIVLLFHYTFNGIANGKISSIDHIPGLIEVTKYGYLGVELFFMISGYVIFFSAKNRSASQFAVARALRLYPLFWFAVVFTAFFAFFWGGEKMSVYPAQIIANLTMVTPYLGYSYVDGVYWTLLCELKFYFIIFVLLIFGLQNKLNAIFTAWPLVMLVAFLLGKGEEIAYMGSVYYYFVAGALFAIVKDNRSIKVYLSLILVYLLSVKFSIDRSLAINEAKGFDYSGIVVALVISTFFAWFVFLGTKRGASLSLPKSAILGALTYPIYLIHAHFGYMFISRFANEENKVFIYILTMLIVFVVAYVMHQLIEVKMAALWKSLFQSTLGRVTAIGEGKMIAMRQRFSSRKAVELPETATAVVD